MRKSNKLEYITRFYYNSYQIKKFKILKKNYKI